MEQSTVGQEMFSKIAEWLQSGLSQKSYCEQHNIRYHIFHYWYKRYRQAQAATTGSSFVALHVQPSFTDPATVQAELLFADGKRIVFYQPLSADFVKAIIA